jgi:hypothetical protein
MTPQGLCKRVVSYVISEHKIEENLFNLTDYVLQNSLYIFIVCILYYNVKGTNGPPLSLHGIVLN